MIKPSINLPRRSVKPRSTGLTCIVDKGMGLNYIEDILSSLHSYIDIWKIGWAGSYIIPDLEKRLELIGRYDVDVCLGGMMFEISYQYKQITEYADWLKALDIRLVEVSNGSFHIPENEKRIMIEYFSKAGFRVLSEVGSKDITHEVSAELWSECVHADSESGAWKVILEGRADASAGIYHTDGTLHEPIIDQITASGYEVSDLVFEAPHKRHMAKFVSKFGSDVNLANIPLEEILNLECIRLGLRGDTASLVHT